MKNAILLIKDGKDENPKIGILCSKTVKDAAEWLESIKGEFEDSMTKIVEVEYKGNVTSAKLEGMLKKICRQIEYVVPKEDKK